MSSEKEYLEKMDTAQLEALLRGFCNGWCDISANSVLTICEILSERDPRKTDPHAAFRRFCENYLPYI